MIEYISEHYISFGIITCAIMNIVNASTKHYQSQHKTFAKFMMWFLEYVPIVIMQSKDAPGWFKKPLKSVPPERPPTVEERNPPKVIINDK